MVARKFFSIISIILIMCLCISFAAAEQTDVTALFSIGLSEMTDEQLEAALQAIRNEQRARIPTKITLDNTELTILAGNSQKIEAAIIELPEGEKAPKLEWTTSDKAIATCNNGTIKAISGGNAVITCSTTLSDGTYIYETCSVQVDTPVKSISVDNRSIKLKGGKITKPVYKVTPENATNQKLTFVSSNEKVAKVYSNGAIEGIGSGKATITAKATDGSGKEVSITVNVEDKRIKKDIALKVALTVIVNDRSTDIYNSDGYTINKRLLHSYKDFNKAATLKDKGSWTSKDGENSWHVSNLTIVHKDFGTVFKYSMDITFDGRNYHALNVEYIVSNSENALSNNETMYPYLMVTPAQIAD